MTATLTSPDLPEVEYLDYRPRGASKALFKCRDPEVLLDGPAGTGKSRSAGEYLNKLAEVYPGCRLLVCRKTRASLSESWMVTFEEKVLWPGHPTITPHRQRTHRTNYHYPNGSHIVLGGMDQKTRLFSTEYDVIYVNEATELAEDDWESFHRALRNHVVPYQQLLGDCNPDAEYHWLNQRCLAGRTTRLKSFHTDNPTLTKDYLERLSHNLTGVQRERLFLGRWVTAEGAIWANFDPHVHCIDGELVHNRQNGWWQIDPPEGEEGEPIVLDWFFAAVDWGFRNPGVIGVYGVTRDHVAYMVYEIYMTGKDIDWWAERAVELRKKFDIKRFVCDPSEPEHIRKFNREMNKGGDVGLANPLEFAGAANNARKVGFSIVRRRFETNGVFFLRGALEHEDPELVAAKKPTCTTREIPSYVYREIKDGQPVKEEQAPDSIDHGCDALRYGLMFLDRADWKTIQTAPTHEIGTIGKMLDHPDWTAQ